jgi:large subunit ribosomal protein L29
MPIIRLKEISSMTTEERTKKINELRAELTRLRTMISAGGAIENPSRVRDIRKTIARLLTIENEYTKGIRKAEGKNLQSTQATPAKKPKEKKTK